MDYPVSDPTVGLVGGKFTDGDPASAVPPSRDPASWANLVTDELINILVAFGVSPSDADNGQIASALLAGFANIGGNASQAFQASSPAQFDNSKKVATTEFVKARGVNFSGFRTITVNEAIPAADVGKAIFLVGAGGLTVTLPSAAAVPAGNSIFLSSSISYSAPSTIQRAGTDSILINGTAGQTSLQLRPASDIELVSNGSNTWAAIGGLAKLGDSIGEFAFLLAASGYQKLPSGLIMQWFPYTTPAGGSIAITFPVAFPTVCYAMSFCQFGTNVSVGHDAPTNLGTIIRSYLASTGAAIANQGLCIALGK